MRECLLCVDTFVRGSVLTENWKKQSACCVTAELGNAASEAPSGRIRRRMMAHVEGGFGIGAQTSSTCCRRDGDNAG